MLLEGEADVTKGGERINKLGPGDFFGEIALVARFAAHRDRDRHHAGARARDHRPLFRRLMDDSPEIQRKVLVALAERLAPAL